MKREVAPVFILASRIALHLTQQHVCVGEFLKRCLFRRNLNIALFTACSAACFTDEFTATEAFVAFDGHDAAAVADVAFQHAFLGSELSCSFAFVAFGGN